MGLKYTVLVHSTHTNILRQTKGQTRQANYSQSNRFSLTYLFCGNHAGIPIIDITKTYKIKYAGFKGIFK